MSAMVSALYAAVQAGLCGPCQPLAQWPGPVFRSFSAQRHDRVPILACRLRQLERLACIEHLPHVCISAAQYDAP